MHYGLESVDIRLRHFADIFTNLGNFRRWMPEIATRVEIRVEANYLVPRVAEELDCNRTDVTLMPCEK
jgi:hypothetical protein